MYKTSQGFEVEFLSIPRAIEKFHLTHPQPEPPQYEIQTAVGVVEKHFHTEKTLETDEDKGAWKAYQRALNEYNEKFLRVCFVKGIIVHATMDEWVEEQKALEIPVAENLTERKIEWLLDKVVSTKEDFEQIMLGVMKASGAPEELLTQIESLFRGQMGESNGNGIEESADLTDETSMVLQPEIRGSIDGVRDENTAEPVRPLEGKGQGVRHKRAKN